MPDSDLTDGAVVLRQWRPTDADWYADAAHDPEIQRYTTERPTLTAAQVRAAISALADQTDTVGRVICDTTTGQRPGNIALRLDAGVGEVSYWVAATARGRGLATSALRLLSEWAFAALGLSEIRLWTHVDNVASRLVAERAGYRRARDHDQERTVNGRVWDTVGHLQGAADQPGQRPPTNPASKTRALAGLVACHLVRQALRVADLRGRCVAGAVQAAVNRVRDVLVRVWVGERVVVELHRAAHVVSNESEPEPVVTRDGRASVDAVVLDRVEGDAEWSAEWTRPTVDADASVDPGEVDLHRRRICGVDSTGDRPRVHRVLLTAEHEGRTGLDGQPALDGHRAIAEAHRACGHDHAVVAARRQGAGAGCR
jgi:ribosomal-protein-alanine N-acetyltransferase